MYSSLRVFSFSRSKTGDEVEIRSKEKPLSMSLMVKRSLALPEEYPSSPRKLMIASLVYPAARNQLSDTGFFRFETLDLSALRSSDRWANLGMSQPKAL